MPIEEFIISVFYPEYFINWQKSCQHPITLSFV